MKKVAKGFLFAFASLAALLFLAALVINFYVESGGVQARLQAVVSRELGMPVKLARVRFSFWSGLQVDGVTIPGEGKEPFLTAESMSARLAWRPLLSRKLVIREVLISSPKVVWVQTKQGKWELPKSAEPPETKAKPQPKPATPAPPRDKSARRTPAATPGEEDATAEAEKKSVEFQIVLARIRNASFRFLDREGKPAAIFEGVSVNIPLATTDRAHGDATIQRLKLHDSVAVEEITTPFAYDGGRLTLPKVKARIAGGSLDGDFAIQPADEGAPFALHVRFEKVDLNRLVAEVDPGGALRQAEGKLAGNLELRGRSSQKKTIEGKGQAVLTGGRMEQYPLLQMLGQTFRIEDLERLDLRQAKLEVRIARERIYVERLVLESTNLNLSAKGEIRFNGKLDLDAGLAVNEKIARQIPKWLYSNFKPQPESDLRALPFKVTGTLEDPKTDLIHGIMGETIERQATDLLKAFRNLATGDKEKKKKSDKEKKKH